MTQMAEQDAANPPFRDRLWQERNKARMNVLYYEHKIARLERIDFWLRIVSALCASAGVAIAVRYAAQHQHADWLPIAVGALAGVIGVVSSISNFGERIKTAATILPRYVEHWHALDACLRRPNATAEDMERCISQMNKTEVLEAEKIRTSDRKLLDHVHALVERENHGDPVSAR